MGKYLSLFNNLQEFEAAYPTFEEANYSIINKGNEINLQQYHPSTRTTQGDNEVIMKYLDQDIFRMSFFLEVIWGTFGWEWTYIAYNQETEKWEVVDQDTENALKGGNFYKVKNMTKVVSIPDANRIQHIRNFLNSQPVTEIENFSTDTFQVVDYAFKRNDYDKSNYSAMLPLKSEISQFPNAVSADGFLEQSQVTSNVLFRFPLITKVTEFCKNGAYTKNLSLDIPELESFTNGFYEAFVVGDSFNSEDLFNTLTSIKDLSNFLYGAKVVNTTENTFSFNFDLTNVEHNNEINLSHLLYTFGPISEFNGNSLINITLSTNNPVNLEYAFSNITNNQKDHRLYAYKGESTPVADSSLRTSFAKMSNNIESYKDKATSLQYTLSYNRFHENIPLKNSSNSCDKDDFIYRGSLFDNNVTYNFSPNNTLRSASKQFDDCTFNGAFGTNINLTNISKLNRPIFRNQTYPSGTTFPYVLYDENNNYEFPNNGLGLIGDFDETTGEFIPNNLYNQIIPSDGTQPYVGTKDQKYQFVSFSGSNLSRITNQKIYTNNWVDLFRNCANIDFPEGSNVEVYFQSMQKSNKNGSPTPISNDLNTLLEFKNLCIPDSGIDNYMMVRAFEGCSSMTRTPKLYGTLLSTADYTDSGRAYGNRGSFECLFAGCPNLEVIDAENLHFIFRNVWDYSGTGAINLRGYSNLRILKLGRFDCGLDIRQCPNIDIPELVNTIKRQTNTKRGKFDRKLWIDEATWTTIVNNYPNARDIANECFTVVWKEES